MDCIIGEVEERGDEDILDEKIIVINTVENKVANFMLQISISKTYFLFCFIIILFLFQLDADFFNNYTNVEQNRRPKFLFKCSLMVFKRKEKNGKKIDRNFN